MKDVKSFVAKLEAGIQELLRTEGADVVAEMYDPPEGLSKEELIRFCVGVEYENAFK